MNIEDIRTPMQVYNDLEAGIPSPFNGVVEVFQLTVHVGFTLEGGHGPVAHGDADVVQTRRGHFVEVVGPDEIRPVVGETVLGLILTQHLSQSPFVDGSFSGGIKD